MASASRWMVTLALAQNVRKSSKESDDYLMVKILFLGQNLELLKGSVWYHWHEQWRHVLQYPITSVAACCLFSKKFSSHFWSRFSCPFWGYKSSFWVLQFSLGQLLFLPNGGNAFLRGFLNPSAQLSLSPPRYQSQVFLWHQVPKHRFQIQNSPSHS